MGYSQILAASQRIGHGYAPYPCVMKLPKCVAEVWYKSKACCFYAFTAFTVAVLSLDLRAI